MKIADKKNSKHLKFMARGADRNSLSSRLDLIGLSIKHYLLLVKISKYYNLMFYFNIIK